MTLALGIILLVLAVFLVIAVLLQQGKNAGLGAISGGNDSYYGQGKTMTKDKILSRLTTVIAIIFCIVVLLVFMLQGSNTATTTNNANGATEDQSQTGDANVNVPAESTPAESTPAESTPSESEPAPSQDAGTTDEPTEPSAQ